MLGEERERVLHLFLCPPRIQSTKEEQWTIWGRTELVSQLSPLSHQQADKYHCRLTACLFRRLFPSEAVTEWCFWFPAIIHTIPITSPHSALDSPEINQTTLNNQKIYIFHWEKSVENFDTMNFPWNKAAIGNVSSNMPGPTLALTPFI